MDEREKQIGHLLRRARTIGVSDLSFGPQRFCPSPLLADAVDTCRLPGFGLEVPDVITLNTRGLHGTPFDRRHYGGPLALFRLCRLVRTETLKDVITPRIAAPIPQSVIYQMGDGVLSK